MFYYINCINYFFADIYGRSGGRANEKQQKTTQEFAAMRIVGQLAMFPLNISAHFRKRGCALRRPRSHIYLIFRRVCVCVAQFSAVPNGLIKTRGAIADVDCWTTGGKCALVRLTGFVRQVFVIA